MRVEGRIRWSARLTLVKSRIWLAKTLGMTWEGAIGWEQVTRVLQAVKLYNLEHFLLLSVSLPPSLPFLLLYFPFKF